MKKMQLECDSLQHAVGPLRSLQQDGALVATVMVRLGNLAVLPEVLSYQTDYSSWSSWQIAFLLTFSAFHV